MSIDPNISQIFYTLVSDNPRGIMHMKMCSYNVPAIFRTAEEAQYTLNKSINEDGVIWEGEESPPEYRVEQCMITLLPPLNERDPLDDWS